MKLGLTCQSSKVKKREEFDNFIKILDDNDINYVIGDTCYNDTGFLGATDQEKADEFHRFIKDDTITHIYCYKGGYGSVRALNLYDFDLIKQYDKVLIGYSDVTALINNMPSNIKCFHGPMGFNVVHENSFNDLFSHVNQQQINHGLDLNFVNCEQIEGEIVGGNLIMINSLLATDFEVDFKDKYLLIEEVGEYAYVIDRLLTQLKLANKLQLVKGFIIGTFTNCKTDKDGVTYEDVIKEHIYSLNKPMITNYPIGHNFDTYTLPIKQKIKIDQTAITYLTE